jgi:hypothetical protein
VTDQTKSILTEERIPTHWVDLLPDLPGAPEFSEADMDAALERLPEAPAIA